MSANAELIRHVSELFLPLAANDISHESFFGGFAFKSNGKQFAMIMGDTLYFCVNENSRKKYEALGSKPFSYVTKKGRVNVRKYYSVPKNIFENQDFLILWANEAIKAAYSN